MFCRKKVLVNRVLPVYCLFWKRVTRWDAKAMSSCSQCGKQRKALKRCSRCKQASYCGVTCQNAAWKGHRKTCLTVEDVFDKVDAAHLCRDWREVIKWEGRMEEMMEDQPDAVCHDLLEMFSFAHGRALNSTGSKDHCLSTVRLETRRGDLLGKMQRFRDQGVALCSVSEQLLTLGKRQEAAGYLQRARKIAEKHGFYSVEFESCTTRKHRSLRGRCHRPRTDGTECSFPFHQRALPHTRNRRGRATSRALSRGGQSGFGKGGWRHLLACSQPLHECATSRGAVHLHPLCGIPFPLLCSCIPPRPMASVTDFTTPAYRLAQVEPHSLARHARGLKRPRGRCALCSTCCATTRQQ